MVARKKRKEVDFEELDGLLTEGIFNHRWVLLETYWEVGRLLSSVEGYADRIEEFAQRLSQRPKTIHYCIELYKAYPRLESLPEGKNVSWYKICKTLPPYEKVKTKKRRQTKD